MMNRIIAAGLGIAIVTSASAQSSVKTADYSFTYSYPAEAAAIPPLRAWLEADRAKQRTALARDAAEARQEARKGSFPFRAYELQKTWKLVTNTPRFLSLSGNVYSYTGGAHGNPGSFGLVWDKAAKRRVEPKAVFVSDAALQAAVGQAFCDRLNAIRTQRRGEAPGHDGPFDACPKIGELTVLLGSSNRNRINRIGLIADPYVAGPYAEGEYEVTLPVTAAVLRAVKPAYRTAFDVAR